MGGGSPSCRAGRGRAGGAEPQREATTISFMALQTGGWRDGVDGGWLTLAATKALSASRSGPRLGCRGRDLPSHPTSRWSVNFWMVRQLLGHPPRWTHRPRLSKMESVSSTSLLLYKSMTITTPIPWVPCLPSVMYTEYFRFRLSWASVWP